MWFRSASLVFITSLLLIFFVFFSTPKTTTGTVNECFPDSGYAYKAYFKYKPANLLDALLYDVELYNNEGFVAIWQNGKKLTNAYHADIRSKGNGRYSLWGNTIYISSIDNQPITKTTKFTYEITLLPSWISSGILASLLCAFFICLLSYKFPIKLVLTYWFNKPTHNIPIKLKYYSFGIVFFISFLSFNHILSSDTKTWNVTYDSSSYLTYEYDKPWGSLRSPGYRLFIDLIDYENAIHVNRSYNADNLKKEVIDNIALDEALQRVANAQSLLLSLSLAFLSATLLYKLPAALCVMFLIIAASYAPFYFPSWIIPDILLSNMCILVAALLISFFSTRQKFAIFMASILAVYAFLLKPIGIILTAIVGSVLLYEFIKNIRIKKEALTYFCLGFFLAVGVLAFPIQLYVQGNIITLGQHTYVSRGMETVAFMDEAHIKYLDSEKDINTFNSILKMRDEYHTKLDPIFLPNGREHYSDFEILHRYINTYGYKIFLKILENTNHIPANTALDKYVKAKNFYDKLMPAIKNERYSLYVTSFLNSFALSEKNIQVSNFIKTHYNIYKYLVLIVILSLILGLTTLKSTIATLFSIHLLNMLATSMGHIVIERYTQLSEWFFFLAVLVGIYSLICNGLTQLKSRAVAKELITS